MDKCLEHGNRPFKFFCILHSKLCCDMCTTENHRLCNEMKSIKEMSKNFTKTEDFHNLSKRVRIIDSKTELIQSNAEEKVKLIEQNYTELVDAVRKTRKDLNETLDTIETELLKQAQLMKAKNLRKVKNMTETFKKTKTEMEELVKQIGNLHTMNQESEIFIRMKTVESKLKAAEAMIVGVDNAISVEGFMFLPNSSLQTMLQKPGSLGKFYPNLWAEHETDINIRTHLDTANCWITGSAVLPGLLVVSDYGNSKVKVIDSEKLSLQSQLTIPSRPWAVAKVSNRQVAISVPYIKKILILKIAEFPLIEKEIGTSSKCHGVACWDNKLIVTFSKKDMVEVIDMTGNVLHTIKTEITGHKLFSFPEYVTLSPNNQYMYVSNYCDNSVVCIGLDGKVKGSFKDSNLIQPRITAVDAHGIIYICGYGSDNVLLMSQDLKKVKILLDRTAFLHSPRTIGLTEKGNQLFVDHSPDKIKVFKVSHYLTQNA